MEEVKVSWFAHLLNIQVYDDKLTNKNNCNNIWKILSWSLNLSTFYPLIWAYINCPTYLVDSHSYSLTINKTYLHNVNRKQNTSIKNNLLVPIKVVFSSNIKWISNASIAMGAHKHCWF
jgi:hypothetical protein